MKKLSTRETAETPKKVTLEELLARAAKSKTAKKESRELHVKSLGGTITIEKPDRAVCLEALDMDNSEEADEYIVYHCVVNPPLKDKALQEAYGVVSPMEIVAKIFEPGEISAVSKECLVLAGYIDSVKVVDDIKN